MDDLPIAIQFQKLRWVNKRAFAQKSDVLSRGLCFETHRVRASNKCLLTTQWV
jgi:hypothetical protein